MKKGIFCLLLFLSLFCFSNTVKAAWYNNNANWPFRKQITINHAQVASSTSVTLANFPVLISLPSDASLSVNASSTGNDIVFTDSDGITKLNHEIESYASSSGALVAWVKVPSLSTSTDTVFYMYYGNASSTNQQNVTSTWDGNYKGVWHLSNGTVLSGSDSIASGHTMTNAGGSIASAGEIDGAGIFGAANGYMSTPAFALSAAPMVMTFSAWTKISSAAMANRNTVFSTTPNNTNGNWGIEMGTLGGSYSNAFTVTVPGFFVIKPSDNSYPTDGAWHQIAFSRNGTGDTFALYIDGVLQSKSSPSGVQDFIDSGNTKQIGVRTTPAVQLFNGSIDEVRYSNSVRSADWIKTEYKNQSSPGTFMTLGSAITFDATPPSVSITSPASGVAISSTITVTAAATDNVGISGVQFQLDGANLGTEVTATSSPNVYSVPWNTAFSTNASHTLTAIAYDLIRNSSTSVAVTVTVNNVTPGLPLINFFTANSIGSSSNLSWSITGATGASIDNGLGAQSSSGSVAVSPTSPTTYTLTATNANGNSTSTAAVVVPGAPTSVSAVLGNAQATVSFTSPISNGGSTIIQYTATANPGNITASASSSPIIVAGLTNGTSYTFAVTATNAVGTSVPSGPSSASTPDAILAPWYNASWAQRQTIAVSGSTAGAETNYQVKIIVPYTLQMKPDFSDIRFTNADGTTLLNYWLESKTDTVTATFWVKVTAIPVSPAGTNVYMYYGNPAATSVSSGSGTFNFFDTFGSGATPGDWNWSFDTAGEHGIIKNGKLYEPLEDQQTGANSGLVILNPSDGTVIKHFIIPSGCLEAAPAIDKNGFVHQFACSASLYKIDQNTGVVATLSTPSSIDWEATPYDSVNDIVLVGLGGVGLRAVKALDYSTVWTNANVHYNLGNAELGPPLIVGANVYTMDSLGKIFKISLATGVTVASTSVAASPIQSYAQMIYDSANDRIYATNSVGHTAFALNASDLSLVWSKVIESSAGGWNFYRGSAYHNNVLYVNIRDGSFRSKIYALDTQNAGNVLWVNTTPFDTGGQQASSILVDDNYAYVTSNDPVSPTIVQLLIINISDGTVAASVPLLHAVASSIPTVYAGKIIVGLYYNFGYQAVQVRDGGGTGDFSYKADSNYTGYVGASASGPLTSRTVCDYSVLDPSKWTVSNFYYIVNCAGLSTTNRSTWANFASSIGTFNRSGTAIRVRAKSAETTSASWDTYAGLTNTIGTAAPISSGEFNGKVTFSYDQNGVAQTVSGPAYAKDQYNTTEVKMAYPNLQFDVNDINITSTTNWSTAFNNVPLKLGNFSGRDVVDWALVRNYVYPEPSASLGSVMSLVAPAPIPIPPSLPVVFVPSSGGFIIVSTSSATAAATTTAPIIPPTLFPSTPTPQALQTTINVLEAQLRFLLLEMLQELQAKLLILRSASGQGISTPTPSSCIPSAAALGALSNLTAPFTRDLFSGTTGSDVEQLQKFLIANDAGPEAKALGNVGATGLFFGLTQKALSEYQKGACISPTGYFGVLTKFYLNSLRS